MAKVKKKRTVKDLDKLWRAGKYWDWIQLVVQNDQLQHYSAQWQEAWRNLCRQALRLPGQLQEFWPRLEAQPQAPELPDLVFLRCLKDFFAGRDVRSLMAALTGLSPPAQMLRGKLLNQPPAAVPERKLSRLLNLLMQQPDKVTGKTYNDLAALVQPNPLATALLSLGNTINQLRKLNRKGGLNPYLPGLRSNQLKKADALLAQVASTWDPAVHPALLHPFCYQLWQCFQRLWETEDFDTLLYLMTFLPFLSSQTFGLDAAKLQDYSRQQAEGSFSEAEHLTALEQSYAQGLDSQALALGQIRKMLKLDTFEPPHRFLAQLRTAYLRLLKEIGRLQTELKPREKIDLMRVMDPILFEDRHWLEDEDTFWEDFLSLAFASGVAGVKLSIQALLTPDFDIHPSLRKQAKEILRQLPYPGDQHIQELLLDPDILPFPDLHRVKPLFQLYPNQGSLRQLFVDQVSRNLGLLLVSSAISLNFETGKKARQVKERNCQGGMQTLTRSLAELQEYAEVKPLQEFALCFPEGYLTPAGYQNLLQRLYERTHSLDQLLSQLDECVPFSRLPDLLESPFVYFYASQFLEDYETLLLQFITHHLADLETSSLETIHQLIDKFCYFERPDPKIANFFLHLANLLQRRFQAGETAAEALIDHIMSTVIAMRQTGRPRKRRSRK
jgi:hypothetical protein